MVTAEEIRLLPTDEKLRMMELLWADLSATEGEIESPGWHANVLKETTSRFDAGLETPIDWTDAKRELQSDRK